MYEQLNQRTIKKTIHGKCLPTTNFMLAYLRLSSNTTKRMQRSKIFFYTRIGNRVLLFVWVLHSFKNAFRWIQCTNLLFFRLQVIWTKRNSKCLLAWYINKCFFFSFEYLFYLFVDCYLYTQCSPLCLLFLNGATTPNILLSERSLTLFTSFNAQCIVFIRTIFNFGSRCQISSIVLYTWHWLHEDYAQNKNK